MDSITFKNFRQFKDETTFELKNINILVGKNNSGKSTLTKGLRLYLDNLKNLTINPADIHTAKDESHEDMYIGRRYTPFFRMGNAFNNPHLGTYGRSFSKESKDDYILFSARFGHIVIETIVSRYYHGDDGNIVDCFNRSSAPISQITISDDNMASRCILNFEKHIQTIEIDARENSVLYKVWKNNIEEIQSQYRRIHMRTDYWDYEDKMRIDRFDLYLSVKHKEFIKFEIDLLNGTFADGVNDDDDADAAFDRSSDGSFYLYPSLLKYALYNCGSSPDFFYDYVCEEDSMLYELGNVKVDQEGYEDYSHYFLEDVFTKTRDDLTHFINQAQVEYIEAHSVTHSIVYNGSDKNDYMAQTILHYLNENIRENDPEKEFVEDWMMKFDIGEDFEIESIGGECYKLGIIEDVDHPENITPLLDKGVGSNQIMILLLQLATIMHKNRGASVPPMVIIEEPEQNLHPKLQSCLADLFREVYLYPQKQNPKSRGISFLIETHSEYLVRKSQVLVAKREQTDANPFTVFYMEKGKEPREIRYQDSGVFYDDFGDGFYDEAISLTEEIV